jgi:hypothetical protein
MAQQDGLLRGLVQYLWRNGAGERLFYLAHYDAP